MVIEKRVLLLAIYKKKDSESLTDILITLENSNLFSLKDGKKLLKELKQDNYIENNSLTLTGIAKAKLVDEEFKIK